MAKDARRNPPKAIVDKFHDHDLKFHAQKVKELTAMLRREQRIVRLMRKSV